MSVFEVIVFGVNVIAKSLSNPAAELFTSCNIGNNEVSSTSNFALFDNSLARSFTYIKNSGGVSINPCEIPALTLVHVLVSVSCPLKNHVRSLKARQICHLTLTLS